MCALATRLSTRENPGPPGRPRMQSSESALKERRVSLSKPWHFKSFRMRTYKKHAKMYGSSTRLTPLESTKVLLFRQRRESVTPLESALTKRVRRKSFRMIQLHQSGGGGSTPPHRPVTPLESVPVFPLAPRESSVNPVECAVTSIRQETTAGPRRTHPSPHRHSPSLPLTIRTGWSSRASNLVPSLSRGATRGTSPPRRPSVLSPCFLASLFPCFPAPLLAPLAHLRHFQETLGAPGTSYPAKDLAAGMRVYNES